MLSTPSFEVSIGLDLSKAKEAITKWTKAMLYVPFNGRSGDMNRVVNFCKENGLFLIEDAAEVIGANLVGKPCGSFGDLSIMSFYANKHISTGEGGMVFTNNPLLRKIILFTV